MKNIIVAAAVLAMAAPAMASKARLTALGNSPHLSDTRIGLSRPAELAADHVIFEMGDNSATPGSPNAEGGFVRSHGDARWGFYLGNHDVLNERSAGFLINENPIDFGYAAKSGDMDWGVGLAYSNSDNKAASTKQSYMALKGGVITGPWEVNVQLGLTDSATDATDNKWTGKSAIDLYAGYTMDNNYYFFNYNMNGGKAEDAGGTTTEDNDNSVMSLGYVNTTKSDGVDFFYGVAYQMSTDKEKVADAKTEETRLPFWIGLEAEANSWLVLRASVTQNILLGSRKVNGGDPDSIANNTTVAAGAGIKWGKAILDATLAGSNTGVVNGNTLFTNAALTYNF